MSQESIYQIGVSAEYHYGARKKGEKEDKATSERLAHLNNLLETFFPPRIDKLHRRIADEEAHRPRYDSPDPEMVAFHEEVRHQAISSYRGAIAREAAKIGETAVEICKLTSGPGAYEQATQDATQHFRINEDSYYDLAVIEACLKGVQLNIDHPVVAGDLSETAAALDHKLQII